MRRLWIILLAIGITLVGILLAFWNADFVSLTKSGQNVVSFITIVLQLASILAAIALALFVITKYAQYLRPRRFIFEGFRNEEKLLALSKLPLNLSMLAQEELVRQVELLSSSLQYVDEAAKQTGWRSCKDTAFTEEFLDENSSRKQFIRYFPADQAAAGQLVKDLEKVIKYLKDREGNDLMNLMAEVAPKELTPIMKIVDAIIPPHFIKASGHLQWQHNGTPRVGMTFEFVDLGEQRSLMIQTLWKTLRAPDSSSGKAHQISTHSKDSKEIDEKDIQLAIERYIELLKPAMHMLALVFLEQRVLSHVSLGNRLFKNREKERRARLYYLLGTLCYATVIQLKPDQYSGEGSSFFSELAFEYLRKSSEEYESWYMSYLYLGDIYRLEMRRGENVEKLLQKALFFYNQAFKHTEQLIGKEKQYAQIRIRLAKAMAEANVYSHKDEAIEEIELLEKDLQSADFASLQESSPMYLHNFATCYYDLAMHHKDNRFHKPGAKRAALQYLARSLAHSQSKWDIVDDAFKGFFGRSKTGLFVLDILKDVLAENLKEYPELETLIGKEFEDKISAILRQVEREVEWNEQEESQQAPEKLAPIESGIQV